MKETCAQRKVVKAEEFFMFLLNNALPNAVLFPRASGGN